MFTITPSFSRLWAPRSSCPAKCQPNAFPSGLAPPPGVLVFLILFVCLSVLKQTLFYGPRRLCWVLLLLLLFWFLVVVFFFFWPKHTLFPGSQAPNTDASGMTPFYGHSFLQACVLSFPRIPLSPLSQQSAEGLRVFLPPRSFHSLQFH